MNLEDKKQEIISDLNKDSILRAQDKLNKLVEELGYDDSFDNAIIEQ